MKCLSIFFLFVAGSTHSAAADRKTQSPPVLVLSEVVSADSGCDKYCWYTVRVLRTLRGNMAPGTKLRVAELNVGPRISGKCQLHLAPYNPEIPSLGWRVSVGTQPVCNQGATNP